MNLTESFAPKSDHERWLPVVGYEGSYEVSDLGRVRSLDRTTCDGKHLSGQAIKPFKMPSGHLRIALGAYGSQHTLKVHRLVLEAFVGPCPDGMESLHGNGIPYDCRLLNLHWGTKSENALDQVEHGVHNRARKTHCPAGHPYSPENTYIRPLTQHRRCRTCTRDNLRAAYQTRMANRKAA